MSNKLTLVISLLILLNAVAYADKDAVVYPIIKGTTVPDRSKPLAVIRNGVAYPVIKGTTVPDVSKPTWRTVPDVSKPTWRTYEESKRPLSR